MDQYVKAKDLVDQIISIYEHHEQLFDNLQENMRAGNSDYVADCIEGIYSEVLCDECERTEMIAYTDVEELGIIVGVECLRISCHYSLEYREFIKELLPELEDAEIKRAEVNLRKYLSNKGKLFPYQVMAYRKNHSEKSRANRNGLLYRPIPLFEKCSTEFDFLMRNTYGKSANPLIQERAMERLKGVIPDLNEEKLKELQKQYSKLRQYTLGEVEEKDVEQYVQFLNYCKSYILRYARPEWRIPEIIALERNLAVDQVYRSQLFAPLPYDESQSLFLIIDNIAYAICCAVAIEDSSDLPKEKYEQNDTFWEGVLKLIMRLAFGRIELKLNEDYQAEYILEHWNCIIFHTKVSLEAGKELLKKKFIEPLEKENDKQLLYDFIYVSVLLCDGHINEIECRSLSSVAEKLFYYQDQILESTDRDGDFDIKIPRDNLQNALKKDGINVDFTGMETLYSKNIGKFLKECKKQRYILLYQQIEKALNENTDKQINHKRIENIAEMYFKRVSTPPNTKENGKSPHLRQQLRNRSTTDFWYNELFELFFPNGQGGEGMGETFYARKIEIIKIIKSVTGIDIFSPVELAKIGN